MSDKRIDPFYTMEFEEEQVIYNAGDESICMYAILQGRVGLFKKTGEGEIQIKSLGEGDFLGAISYLGEVPRRYKAVATQFTRVQQLYDDNIENFIRAHAHSVVNLMDNLSKRLAEADKSIGKIGGIDKCVICEAEVSETQVADQAVKKPETSIMDREQNDLGHPVYPEGHRHYPNALESDHEQFLFDKNVKCPICEFDFTLYQMRVSHFKLKEVKRDMRKVFEGIDEIWYNVWTCPHCKYSNFHYDFLKLKTHQKEALREKIPEKLSGFYPPETLRMSFNEVFDSYYMALACKEILGATAYELGRIWLHLAWMYDDVGDEEMFAVAYDHAREYYATGWFTERVQLTADGEQKLAILISEMSLYCGKLEDARKFIFEAVNIKNGSKALTEQARDRLIDIKALIQKQSQSGDRDETE